MHHDEPPNAFSPLTIHTDAFSTRFRRTTMSDVSSQPGWFQRRLLGVGSLCVLLATLSVVGCSTSAANKDEKKRVEVVATKPIIDPEVVDYQDFTGRLDAIKTVNIVARVTGYLMEVPFKEGDVVQKDAILFQIDPRPFEADLNLAQADLKVAEADANLLQKNADRARKLIGTPGISKEDYDTALAAEAKADQTV